MSAHAVPLIVRGSATAAASTPSDLVVLRIRPFPSWCGRVRAGCYWPTAIPCYDKEVSGQDRPSTLTMGRSVFNAEIVRRFSVMHEIVGSAGGLVPDHHRGRGRVAGVVGDDLVHLGVVPEE